jgi:hypothetical protein
LNDDRRTNARRRGYDMEAVFLEVIREALEKAPSCRLILNRSAYHIEFLSLADNGATYPSRVNHSQKDQTITFGIQHPQMFEIWPGYSSFFGLVDKCTRAIVERDESSLRGFIVPAFHHLAMGMRYLTRVEYATLSDKECGRNIDRAFAQGRQAMGVVESIIWVLREKKGKTPSRRECMQGIYRDLLAKQGGLSAEEADTAIRH